MRIMFTIQSKDGTKKISLPRSGVTVLSDGTMTQIRSFEHVVMVDTKHNDVVDAIESNSDLEADIVQISDLVQEVDEEGEINEEVDNDSELGIIGQANAETANTTQETLDNLLHIQKLLGMSPDDDPSDPTLSETLKERLMKMVLKK